MIFKIDWVIVLIKTPVFDYMKESEVLELSLANKRIRSKIFSIFFKNLKCSDKILKRCDNYFNQKKYCQIGTFGYNGILNVFLKYGFNMDLAFKEIYIDPFIEENIDTTKFASRNCKSLSFEESKGACYFTFPIFENFYNLNDLTLRRCEVPYTKFSNLLAKLQNLEILIMEDLNLVLKSNEKIGFFDYLRFPKSLKELTHVLVHLEITDLPQTKPLEFVLGWETKVIPPCLDLNPQLLPNLKYLRYRDRKMGKGLTEGFLALNSNLDIEYGSELIERKCCFDDYYC